MEHVISEKLWKALACPYCGGDLTTGDIGVICKKCNENFPIEKNGQVDLRLTKEKTDQVSYRLGVDMLPEDEFDLHLLEVNQDSPIDLNQQAPIFHLPHVLLSHFPKATKQGALMLDLGSGEGPHKGVVEELGFEWIGLDYDSKMAPLLGDAHALPFKEAQVEFVLSIQTFEHLNYPFIAAKEVFRALKPGGLFIGSVSFLEPYHQYSFFHQTHLGVRTLLTTAGFEIDAISPHPRTALQALGKMSLFRLLPLWMVKLLVMPIEVTHRLWWKLGHTLTKNPRTSETYRRFSTASSFMFVATKP